MKTIYKCCLSSLVTAGPAIGAGIGIERTTRSQPSSITEPGTITGRMVFLCSDEETEGKKLGVPVCPLEYRDKLQKINLQDLTLYPFDIVGLGEE